jgi:tRNA acetyltransferase TAN1
LGNKEGAVKLFCPVRIDLPCVLFFKTSPPIDPVDFVHRICEEIVSKPGIRRMRYVNRLTPVTMTGKATEKGLAELGKTVLGRYFKLSGTERSGEGDNESSYSVRSNPFLRGLFRGS